MKIEANISIEYTNPKYSKIAYKSLEVDNKGFVESKIEKNKIDYKIKSESLGSFLATADDLIASEILIEDVLKNTNKSKNK